MSKSALYAIRTQVMWNRLIAVVEEQACSSTTAIRRFHMTWVRMA